MVAHREPLLYNVVMVIVGVLIWWYSAGWFGCILRVRDKLMGVYDYFSIDLLIRTLFSPFRQISAGRVDGPIGAQLRAFFDRLLSRIIGACVRLMTVVIGACALVVTLVWGVVKIVAWLVVPLLPVVGLCMMLIGWLPWRI